MLVDRNDNDVGIRHYSPPTDETGKGFVLVVISPTHIEHLQKFSDRMILMDDTFNVTMYGLKLTTLTVVDHFDRSLPAGFLLSSSTTSTEVAIFFECLKKLYVSFHPSFCMTDEAQCFWNGFKAVYPNSSTVRVLCRWHVYRAWKKNARELMKGSILTEILDSLRQVLREPRKDRLLHRLLSMLHTLDLDGSSGALKFAEYFKNYYYDRIGEWSATTRANISCHSSMFAEAWHSVLKNIIGNKRGIRCDRLIHLLQEATEFVVQNRETQAQRQLYSACPRKGQNRKTCQKFDHVSSNYLIREGSHGVYKVTKLSEGKEYTIEDYMQCICDKERNTHCDFCGACPYRFSCDCLFSTAAKNERIECAMGEPDDDAPTLCDPLRDDVPFTNINVPQSTSHCSDELVTVNIVSDMDSERTKKLDKLKQMFDFVYNDLRKKKSKSDPQYDIDIENAIMSMERLMGSSTTRSGLVVRPDARQRNATAREIMNVTTMKKRQKSRRQVNTTQNVSLVPKRHIGRCIICAECDPPLPPDAHHEEFESRVTEWKRCALCKQPAHFSCTLAHKQCPCSENSHFELYPEGYQKEIDSDESSESDDTSEDTCN